MKILSPAIAAAVILVTYPASVLPETAPSARRGEVLFLQCRACHTLRAGEPHKIGPNLSGIIGAKAGTRSGYTYTAQLKGAGIRWTDASLDRFLASPAKAVAGNRMAFAGVAKPADRAALIVYLKKATE